MMNDDDYGRLAECLEHVLADATFTCACAEASAGTGSAPESGRGHTAGEDL